MKETQTIQYLLAQTATLKKQYDKIAELTGTNFNVFQLLKIEASEVRLHSTFIAELLNPEGTHGQKELFLALFISVLQEEVVKEVSFQVKGASVDVEKYAGVINDDYTEGGRIDIVITDCEGKRILLENKIYAIDQKNQLLRYRNFDQEALIVYLTLNGEDPSTESTGEELKARADFFTISYRNTIQRWLERCQKEAFGLPILREIIGQYRTLINHLTHQSNNDEMTEEIKSILLQNPEYFESVDLIQDAFQQVVAQIREDFFNDLKDRKPKAKVATWNGYAIHSEVAEDSYFFYYGFLLLKDREEPNAKDEKFSVLVSILKSIDSGFQSGYKNYIGWIRSSHIPNKFTDLERGTIYKLSKPAFRQEFTNKILVELDQYVNEFKVRIDQLT